MRQVFGIRAIVILCVILPLAGFILLQMFLPTGTYPVTSYHVVLETLGLFSGLTLAAFILFMSRTQIVISYRVWVASALIAMAILDGFHCVIPVGISAAWLHSMAMLIGGLLFAMVWVKDREQYVKNPVILPAITAVSTLALVAFLVTEPQWLPPMVTSEGFTATAVTINILSGILFFAGAAALLWRHRQKTCDNEEIVFTSFCLLNGMAAVLFPLSPAWGASWWFWHLLRAAAYILLLALIYDIYRSRELLVQERLRESEERYRTLAESAHDLIYIIDRDDRVEYVNTYAAQQLGLPKEDIIGKPRSGFFPGAVGIRQREIILEVFASGTPKKIESVIPLPAGKTWQDTLLVPMKDQDGQVKSVMGISRDLTERKLAEQELRESEEKFQGVAERSSDIIMLTDEKGRTTYIAPSVREILGYNADEVIGKTPVDLVHPDELDSIYEYLRKNASGRTLTQKQETRVRKKDGDYAILDITVSPIIKDGIFLGAQIIGRDITARKQAEEALLQANRKLNLLSGITRHDIRNQVFTLKGFLELSKQFLGDTAKMSEYIIREERAVNAIEHQIVFTKEYEDLGVKAAIWQGLDTCIRKAQASLPTRDVRVVMDCRDIEVYADPLFERVYYNLIDNALRYGGPDMTTIQISAKVSEKGLVISVEDDGAGISAEDREKLFERGFGKQTGLGLFLSREILSITGILITETGEPGKGARFEILVPKGGYRFTGIR